MVVVGPFLLGGTPPAARAAIDLAVAAAVVLWVLSAPRPTILLVLPVAAGLLACAQVVPLPPDLLGRVAPWSAAAWRAVRDGDGPAGATVSVDPRATVATIAQLVLGLAAAVSAFDLGRDPRDRRRLANALAVAAIVVWGLALRFPMNGEQVVLGVVELRGPIRTGPFWWRTSVVRPEQAAGFGQVEWVDVGDLRYPVVYWVAGDGIGSYVSSNHFAAGMYLAVPALAAWIVEWLRRRIPGAFPLAVAGLLFGAAVCTVAFGAGSRAGAAAMVVAGCVFMAFEAESRAARRAWSIASCAIVGAILLGVVACYGAPSVVARLAPASLRPVLARDLAEGRGALTRAAFAMLAASPALGTGLGTYASLQPSFLPTGIVNAHAHDDAAEFLGEAGLAGGAFLALVVTLLAAGLLRCRRSTDGTRPESAFAWSALSAIAVHSLFDWNFHVPANALLASIVAGLGLGLAAGDRVALRSASRRSASNVLLTGAFLLACLASSAYWLVDAWAESSSRALRETLEQARHAVSEDRRSSAIRDLLPVSQAALAADRWAPDDAERAVLLGQAYLHLSEAGLGPGRIAADSWSREARTRSPVVIGLPQPAPRTGVLP